MEKFINVSKALLSFIEKSKNPYHAVKTIKDKLESEGFTYLSERKVWDIKGGKYYTVRNNSSIIAFTVPENGFEGFNIVAAHNDTPAFKVKELNSIKLEGNYTKLNTESYGGIIMASWMDRPLGVAGRIIVKTENGLKEMLCDTEKEYCIIPNLAIHMQRDINDGHKFNPQVDMLPIIGDENADLLSFLASKYGVNKEDIVSHDLFLYPVEKGRIIGENGEFIGSARLDDLQCSFSAIEALCASEIGDRINIAAIFDNEEVGSASKQGADGSFLTDVLERVFECLGIGFNKKSAILANSFMVSADNAHAVHPNFPAVTDQTNRNYINKGVVIKFNANQKYTTDGVSAAIFKSLCEKNGVPYQVFHNRSDMPGGATLGNKSVTHISIKSVDIGAPQFSMHSAFETAGVKDTYYMIEAMKAFFNSSVNECDGEYTL